PRAPSTSPTRRPPDLTRPRLWREERVEPHGRRQGQVPEQHRLESPRQPQARETEQREPRGKPQRPRGAENHVVGTSVLSRIALRDRKSTRLNSSHEWI